MAKPIVIRILGDTVDFEAALKRVGAGLDATGTAIQQASAKLTNVGKSMMSTGKSMTLGLTLPVFAAGKAALDAGSDMQETLSKTEVLFGESADALVAWADTAANSFGQSKQQALDASATFAVFGKSAGLAGDDLVEFAKTNTELASDLASFNNASPEETIEALGAAFRGEAEPMRRFGVLLDDASMRQKALEMGIVSTTKEALTPQQKVLAAQALIMEQTADAQGDFARTSDGVANSQRIAKARISDMTAEIGTKLIPIVTKVLEVGAKLLTWFDSLSPKVQTAIMVGVGLAAALGPVMSIIGGLVTAIGLLISPVGLVIVAIAALTAGFVIAYRESETFRNIVDTVVQWITGVAWPMLKGAFEGLQQVVSTVFGFISNYIGGQLKVIQGVFNVFAGIFTGDWSRVWDGIKGIFSGVVQQFSAIFSAAWTGLRAAAGAAWDGLVAWFRTMPSIVAGALGGIGDAITAPFRTAFNAIKRLWNNTVGGFGFEVPGWVPGIGGKGFQIPRMAMGGPGNGWAIVGERGPEVVRLPKGSQVFPNHHPATTASGGATVNVYATTNANPRTIGSEVAWSIRFAGR